MFRSVQRILLRAKHWEIFCLWLVLGVLCLVGTYAITSHPLFSVPVLNEIVVLFFGEAGALLVLWPWSYSVGSFCNSIMPTRLRLRPVAFFLAVAGILVLDFVDSLALPLFIIRSWRLAILSLLMLLCVAYTARFPAKTLVIVETRKPAIFWQYWGPFFGVAFFPIGIWILQPRVNELYATYGESSVSADVIHSAPNPSA